MAEMVPISLWSALGKWAGRVAPLALGAAYGALQWCHSPLRFAVGLAGLCAALVGVVIIAYALRERGRR
jgi:hypothetical protein